MNTKMEQKYEIKSVEFIKLKHRLEKQLHLFCTIEKQGIKDKYLYTIIISKRRKLYTALNSYFPAEYYQLNFTLGSK